MVDNDDLDDFLEEVDEISKIVKNLNSDDSATRDEAIGKADSKLGRIKYDRTVINHEAFKDDFAGPPTPGISLPNLPPDDPRTQEIFMAEMEKDAKNRAKRRARNEIEAKKFIEAGNNEFANGNYVEAINLYSEAIHLVRDSSNFYTIRAKAYLKQGSYEEAVKDCDNILYFCKNDLTAMLIKGESFYKLDKFDDARDSFDKAWDLYPLERKAINKWLIDVKQAKSRTEKEANVCKLLTKGDKNMREMEEILTKIRNEKMENEDFTKNCSDLIQLITNDEERIFFRVQNGFAILCEHENVNQIESWETAMDVFDAAVKANEDNQINLFSVDNFVAQFRKILSMQTNASRTLNLLHSLTCDASGRRILVETIDCDWLLKTMMRKSNVKMCIAILINMALNERFRAKLESSFDQLFLPKFRIFMSDPNVDVNIVNYYANLALSSNLRAKMAKQSQFWADYSHFLKIHDPKNDQIIDASLALAANLSADPLPENIKPQIKSLLERIISLVTSKRVENDRIYLVLSRIINSFEGAVKIVLELNFLPHLLQLVQGDETASTGHVIRILVSMTRISKKSQKEVAKKCIFLLKLLNSHDENVVGNSALCLTYCLAVPKLSAYLTQTDVIDMLLSLIKKDELKSPVKSNVGQLLAKLAKSEPEHLLRLRKLRGIEILHSCMNFN